jgi:hypothetical protein
MFRNIGLGSNVVDRVHSVRKIPTRLRCTNLCINCTYSARFASKFLQQRNGQKRTKTRVWGPMGWIGYVRCEKCRHDFVAQTCALIAPVRPILHRSSCSNETILIILNMSLGSNAVDQVRSLQKIPMRHRCMNLCINCTRSAHFAPTCVQ